MDSSALKSESDAPRKRKFIPKARPRPVPKVEAKCEAVEDSDGEQARDLLKRFNEGLTRAKPKVEKKAAQVAFGYSSSSTRMRSFGARQAGNSATREDGTPPSAGVKEYVEPWDYYTYYPTTLPWRRPYSGDPEVLEEESRANQIESLDEPATDLGLMEENPEDSMLFLQLPATLPSAVCQATGNGISQANEKPCSLNELPGGFLGKMLVYRSGVIKLKLGDTLYSVSSGMECGFSQDVVAVNSTEKQCCAVGEPAKRAIITPDVASILASVDEF